MEAGAQPRSPQMIEKIGGRGGTRTRCSLHEKQRARPGYSGRFQSEIRPDARQVWTSCRRRRREAPLVQPNVGSGFKVVAWSGILATDLLVPNQWVKSHKSLSWRHLLVFGSL